jgi:integrase
LGTQDRAEAERRLADFIKAATRDPVTVADAVQAYLDSQPEAKRKPLGYRFKSTLPFFGHYRPDQITAALTRQWIGRQRSKATGSVRSELAYLIAALNHVKAKGWEVPLPRPSPPRERVLSESEVTALLRAARHSARHVRLFIVLALSTGARKSAILQLTWDRVDFTRNRIDLRTGQETATKRRAILPMNRRLRRYLRIVYRTRTCNHVIEYGSRPVLDVKKGLAAAFRRAGISGASAHTLRHTAATIMVNKGVPLQDVAAFLGDTVATVERVYAKWQPDYLDKAARALE